MIEFSLSRKLPQTWQLPTFYIIRKTFSDFCNLSTYSAEIWIEIVRQMC